MASSPFDSDYFGSGFFGAGYFGGADDVADGAISAALGGASAISAALTAKTVSATGGGKRRRRGPMLWPTWHAPAPTPALMSASIVSRSGCTARLSAVAWISAPLGGSASLKVAGTTHRSYLRETQFWLMAA